LMKEGLKAKECWHLQKLQGEARLCLSLQKKSACCLDFSQEDVVRLLTSALYSPDSDVCGHTACGPVTAAAGHSYGSHPLCGAQGPGIQPHPTASILPNDPHIGGQDPPPMAAVPWGFPRGRPVPRASDDCMAPSK
jgi:hypothetical protein